MFHLIISSFLQLPKYLTIDRNISSTILALSIKNILNIYDFSF